MDENSNDDGPNDDSPKRARTVLLWLLLLIMAAIAGALLLIPANTGVSLPWGQLFGSNVNHATISQRLQLPTGFDYSIYADNLGNPRLLRISRNNDLLISDPGQGHITLLGEDLNGDGAPDKREIIIDGLTRPHGLDFYQDWLYIAESNAVGRVRFDHLTGKTLGPYQRIITDLGDNNFHWSKTLRLGPDGWFYLTSGSSCNACEEEDKQRASMMRFKPDGSGLHIYASGLRNSVGFDWSPFDKHLYTTDNGRDWLGDEMPPCELNRIVKNGFYGWPYAHGHNIPDPEFGQNNADKISTAIPPAHAFGAHTAPLGITFLRSPQTPANLQRTALVAQHGSWNRSTKAGYKVVALNWSETGEISEQDFFWGFEKDDDVIGRPVDIAQAVNGDIFVSDDYGGKVYRIGWE